MAAVDAELEGEGEVGVGDPAQGAHHSALVVLARDGDARAEEELAPVAVEVGGQEGHALGGQGCLDDGDRLVERLGEGAGTPGREEVVGSREPDERDGRDAVLRIGGTGSEVVPELVGEEGAQEGRVGWWCRRAGSRW